MRPNSAPSLNPAVPALTQQHPATARLPGRHPLPRHAPPLCRSAAVVVRASAEESRRAVLGGLLAGVAALTASSAQAMDLIDDRKAKANGFDIIYEARDLDLTQAQRDGLAQVRRAAGPAAGAVVEGPGSGRAVEGPWKGPGGWRGASVR